MFQQARTASSSVFDASGDVRDNKRQASERPDIQWRSQRILECKCTKSRREIIATKAIYRCGPLASRKTGDRNHSSSNIDNTNDFKFTDHGRKFLSWPKGNMQDWASKTWLTTNPGWTFRGYYNEFRMNSAHCERMPLLNNSTGTIHRTGFDCLRSQCSTSDMERHRRPRQNKYKARGSNHPSVRCRILN